MRSIADVVHQWALGISRRPEPVPPSAEDNGTAEAPEPFPIGPTVRYDCPLPGCSWSIERRLIGGRTYLSETEEGLRAHLDEWHPGWTYGGLRALHPARDTNR